ILAEVDLSPSAADSALTSGFTSDDLQPRLYEGGFKTWECSVDLARYLLASIEAGALDLRANEGGGTRVVEVGRTMCPAHKSISRSWL
ncbi:MAG: hypothetical protein LQ340_008089, partial [Diploschistes diacapsis]